LPVIAERDEQIQIGESSYHLRRAGDLLHPEYFSRRAVDERRLQLDERTFAAQYQQCPLQPLGVMIKRDAIQRYDQLPIRKESHYVIQSWDTAEPLGSRRSGSFRKATRSHAPPSSLQSSSKAKCFFPREAPWLVDFENKLFAFPYGRYDDQVDAVMQALAHKRPSAPWNEASLKGFAHFNNLFWRGF